MFDGLMRARGDRRRLAALTDLGQRERRLRPGYRVWGYKNFFAKGFLVTRAAAVELPGDTWLRERLGDWHLQRDPDLPAQFAGSGDRSVVVLGYAFAEGGPGTRSKIAARVLRALEGGGQAAVDAEVTWLSGRFVVLVHRGDELDVYHDPLGSRACYWYRTADGVVLASHTGLIAEHVGGLASTRMRWVLQHPDYKSSAGRWLPGRITAHDEVGQVYANGRLTVRGDSVRHERYFPNSPRQELSLDEAAVEFGAALREQVRNWLSVAPTTTLALTAGADSRAILDSSLDLLRDSQALALTYHPFHVPGKSTYDDYDAANRLAAAAGLPHLVLDVPAMSPTSSMAALYNRTFPSYRRYANLANALYLRAPAKAATIFGVGGAVITGMFSDVSDPNLTTQMLARKYAQSAFADDPELCDEFAAWMELTEFSTAALRGYSFYDFFHWEHRMSKWAAEGYSEYDLATIPAPVLSSRRLLVAALSIPEELRTERALYQWLQSSPPEPST